MAYTIKNIQGAALHVLDADTLQGADLRGADLQGADLRGANLTEANLTKAYLAGANLAGANLTKAYLTEARLYEANLRGADLREADLRGADLRGADLREARLPEGLHRYQGEYEATIYPDGRFAYGCEIMQVDDWLVPRTIEFKCKIHKYSYKSQEKHARIIRALLSLRAATPTPKD